MEKPYSYDAVYAATLEYFGGNELATNVWISKYAMQDQAGGYLELTPDDMHWRLAKEFARIENNYPERIDKNPLSPYGQKRKQLTVERIFELLKDFKGIIPQGSIMSLLGNEQVVGSISNCVVMPQPYDSYGGIMFTDQQLTQLYKRRMGVGIDISSLRPDGTAVRNAAKSSTGAVSFMERFSNTTREVAQKGRRGALMETIDIRHPDIEAFIDIKRDLSKVTGANISVMVTDAFMTAVKNNDEFTLQWPIESETPVVTKTVNAKELWQKLISAARDNAEPGIIFRNTMENYTTDHAYGGMFKFVTTNPCQPGFAKVLTFEGVKTFDEIDIGSRIWSSEGWTEITNKWSNGVKPVYRYYFGAASEFVGTQNHRVVTDQGKMEVESCYQEGIPVQTANGFKTVVTREYLGDHEVFDITVDNSTHTYWTTGVNVSNCSEIGMGANDSCRLLAVNLFHAVRNPYTKTAYLDGDTLYKTFYEAMRLMDNVVDLEIEAIDRILSKINQDPEPEYIKTIERKTWQDLKNTAIQGRRTGLGFTALGDTLAALGVRYDAGHETIKQIMQIKFKAEWDASIDLAIERGTFPAFDPTVEKTHGMWVELKDEFPSIYERNLVFGRRNISLSTVAPTGSVSILAKLINTYGTSGGVEPVFQINYTRRKKVNPGETNVRVDFVDDMGDSWQHFDVYHSGYQEWAQVNNVDDLKAAIVDSPYYKAVAPEIDWIKRVEIQGLIQRYTTHSISSTLNLPNDVTEAEVSDIYFALYENGCKGGTIYRDGARTGVLVTEKPTTATRITKNNAPKRPEFVNHIVGNTSVKGQNWVVLVGIIKGDPYEVFALPHGRVKHTNGVVQKITGGEYRLLCEGKTVIPDISAEMATDEQRALTRAISLALRHGADAKYAVEQLSKSGGTIVDFTTAINRILKKALPNGTKLKASCLDCTSTNVVLQEGCLTCYDCGSSKCG